MPIVEEETNVYARLPESQCIHVTDKPNAFIANRDQLGILSELTEMFYNKVRKNEVLEVAIIYQELKTSQAKGKIMFKEENQETDPYGIFQV